MFAVSNVGSAVVKDLGKWTENMRKSRGIGEQKMANEKKLTYISGEVTYWRPGLISNVAGDLISRKALLAEYDRVHIGPPGGARKLMEDAPTVDAVEVVRCKDCRHWIERTADGIDTFHTCWFNDSITGRTHFCRYGERRTDA
jgi:hypothetical protein